MILVDTNIVARTLQPAHQHHKPALDAMTLLHTQRGEEFAICQQVMVELYVVGTRVNGLNMTPEDVLAVFPYLIGKFKLLPDPANLFSDWHSLVSKYKPKANTAYDTRIVALMVGCNIPKILTFNDQHFAPYTEIETLNPFDVLGIPRVK